MRRVNLGVTEAPLNLLQGHPVFQKGRGIKGQSQLRARLPPEHPRQHRVKTGLNSHLPALLAPLGLALVSLDRLMKV